MSAPKKKGKRTRTRTPLKVLMYLARHGEANKWQLSQDLKKAYSNIHATIAKLLEQDLIYISGRKKGEKKPPSGVKYYDLTLLGLLLCLLDERSWQYIDEIAEKYASFLPLVLGKWRHFESAGLSNEFMKAFKWMSTRILQGYPSEWYMRLFFNYIFQLSKAKKEWHKALRGDPELRQWTIKEMKLKLVETYIWTRIQETILHLHEMEGEPQWDKMDLRWRIPDDLPDPYRDFINDFLKEGLRMEEIPLPY